jgi:Flp pilus assembly protein TadD
VSKPLQKHAAVFRALYEAAEKAWFAGDYQATLAILNDAKPSTSADVTDARLLKARALIRSGQFADACELARLISRPGDADRQATALLLEGTALTRLGDFEAAQQRFLRLHALPNVHRTIVAEAFLQEAFLDIMYSKSGIILPRREYIQRSSSARINARTTR